MEFVAHGRRDIRFSCEEEEQDEDSKKSSSSSSSSNNGGRWGLRLDGGDGPSAPLPVPVPVEVEKEHMFDKVVTPSDVGKLNRLVIPKQHAEKYFPLDASGNEKGLLLSFEDRNGKSWRFRYSYWNSSQSYVMTKGWSRFVKEKRLDAGDTVSFGRGVGQTGQDRLFIDWKPRPQLPIPGGATHYQPFVSFARSPPGPWGGRVFVPPPAVYEHNRQIYGCNSMSPGSVSGGGGQFLYIRSPQIGVQPGQAPMVLDSLPVVNSKASAKRVRLFGVNLDGPELGCSDDNGTVPLQMVPELQPRSSIPSLQLRLGGVESSIAATHSEKQKSHLDLHL